MRSTTAWNVPIPIVSGVTACINDGTIADLVEPLSTTGPWSLKQPEKANQPVIPCLACHPIHMENETLSHPGTMDDPAAYIL